MKPIYKTKKCPNCKKGWLILKRKIELSEDFKWLECNNCESTYEYEEK